MKITDHQREVIDKLKEGYHIQVNRQNGHARVINDNSTFVLHMNRGAFTKFINNEIIECSAINKQVINYVLKEGVYV